MVKTYKAIGVQVYLTLLVNGHTVRIEFHPVSNYVAGRGGSEFTTPNEDLQNAIEKDRGFGRDFFIENEEGDLVTHIEEAVKEPEPEVKLETVKVASLSDAKMWLIDNKNWEPKGRVTKKVIQDVAASFGIQFEGLE